MTDQSYRQHKGVRLVEAGPPDLALSRAMLRSDKLIAATEAADTALWSVCPETGETWFSDMWYVALGYEVGAFEPSFDVFLELMHPDDRAGTIAAFEDLLAGRVEKYTADFRLRSSAGDWCWIGAVGNKVDRSAEGLPFIVSGMQMDITRRKQTEARLEELAQQAYDSHHLLDRLAENTPVSLYEFRISAQGKVSVPYISRSFMRLAGVTEEQAVHEPEAIFAAIHPDDVPVILDNIEYSRRNLTHFKQRYRVTDHEGGWLWVQAISKPMRLEDGSTTWHGSLYDVTAEVAREHELSRARDKALQLQAEMSRLALTDGLTGLPNRRHFDAWLDARRKKMMRGSTDSPAILIRNDLDRFKYVNDTLGHAAGDAVLRHVAKVIEQCIDPSDFPARLGGDEFAILIGERRSIEDAQKTVEDIRERLSEPFLFEGKTCRFGASFGVAAASDAETLAGDLLSFADAALYEAKSLGRNRVEVFTTELHNEILEARHLAGEIEFGLEQEEFEPFFQPQVCAQTGALVGIEALARWRSSKNGLIQPMRFIEIAEQIRATAAIDEMILRKTKTIVANWREAGFTPPKISFNVSTGRLRDPGIALSASALQAQGIQVAFELLESILLESQDELSSYTLDLVRDAGILIEVDDFGTGHASILGLQRVRPNALKIDRQLINGIEDGGAARELVQAIVHIARALSIETIVEGVESEAQAAILRDMGCDHLQGFLYAKPLCADDLLAWHEARTANLRHRSARPGA